MKNPRKKLKTYKCQKCGSRHRKNSRIGRRHR